MCVYPTEQEQSMAILPAVRSSRSDITGAQQSHEALLSYIKLLQPDSIKASHGKLHASKATSQKLLCRSNSYANTPVNRHDSNYYHMGYRILDSVKSVQGLGSYGWLE